MVRAYFIWMRSVMRVLRFGAGDVSWSVHRVGRTSLGCSQLSSLGAYTTDHSRDSSTLPRRDSIVVEELC